MKSSLIRLALLAGLTLPATFALAQKKPLDHSVYDSWKSLRGSALSQDGKWLSYTIAPQEGDGVAYIKSINGSKSWEFPRGFAPQFTADGKFAIMMVIPKFEETRKARRDRVLPADAPKATMLVINLETGEKKETERVASFELAPENSNFVIYTPEPPKAVRATAAPGSAPKPPLMDVLPFDDEDQRRNTQWLRDCLAELKGSERQALVLAFEHGLSHADLAAHLQKPLGTVKAWVRRGMENLRLCVESCMGVAR